MNYKLAKTPSYYKCNRCNRKGIRLWRKYQTFLEHQCLLCVDCAEECENRKLGVPYGGDQIGWYIPAVPTIEDNTYWGYTSVPQDGVDWWYSLPLVGNKEGFGQTIVYFCLVILLILTVFGVLS